MRRMGANPMEIELHRFFNHYPTFSEIFRVWNAAKVNGEIPQSWSYSKHGDIRQTYSGWTLFAR